ncbi:hypothetical protein [Streptomyces sp. NPDC101132]|uniref:DUF7544 domain-containing protein n=1 Tax=Streptomyces sp. NPDC101132 TaxID=3366110 RepID=UPI00381D677B
MKQNQGWGPPEPNGGAPHGGPQGAPPPHGQQQPPPYGSPYGYPGAWGGGWAPPPPPQPGVIPLRPLGVGEVLGGSFTTFGRYWKQLVGVMLTVQGVGILVVTLAVGIGVAVVHPHLPGVFDLPAGESPAAEDLDPVLFALVPVGVLLAAVLLLGWAMISALTPAVLQEAVLGRRTTYRAMFRRAWSRLPSMLGTLLLTGLVAGGPLLVALGVSVALVVTAAANSAHGDPGAIVLLLPLALLIAMPVSVWLGVKLSFAPAAVVCENLGPVAALRRSSQLVSGTWWRVFGITLLTALIATVIGYMIQLPFTFVGMFAFFPTLMVGAGSSEPDVAAMVGGMVVYFACIMLGGVVSQLFQVGFPQLASGLLYIDQRIRREDLAPALMAAAAAPPVPPGGPAPAGPF